MKFKAENEVMFLTGELVKLHYNLGNVVSDTQYDFSDSFYKICLEELLENKIALYINSEKCYIKPYQRVFLIHKIMFENNFYYVLYDKIFKNQYPPITKVIYED